MAPTAAVLILCGGFNEQIIEGQSSTSQASAIHGTQGSQRCIPALVSLQAKKSAQYLVRALEGIRRLHPLNANVFFVINEADRGLFAGAAGLFAELSDINFGPENIISNGTRVPSEWQGDIFDLQLALRTIGSSLPVLAVSGSLTFLPGYNLQRVLEHSLIRNRDVIGFSHLSDSDVALLGTNGHTRVQPASSIPVPPLAGLHPGSQATTGTQVAERLLLLKPSTLASPAVLQSTARGLIELGCELLARGGDAAQQLCGIDLEFGRMRMESFACFDYADRYIHYFLQNLKPSGIVADDEFRPDSEENMGSLMSLNRLYASVYDDMPKVLRVTADFDTLFFELGAGAAGDATAGGKTTMKHYTLPSTFYMTAYRRQGADVMH